MFTLKRILAVAVLGIASSAASQAQALDNFAVTHIGNETSVAISFNYKIGNSGWAAVTLLPGQTYGIWAQFTYPGSYVHGTITIAFDQTFGGFSDVKYVNPYVTYMPYVNYNRAVYHAFRPIGGAYLDLLRIV